jgi:electron transfer DM13
MRAIPSAVRSRPVLWALLAAVAGAIVVGVYWFEPQKLVIDEKVDEVLPAPRNEEGQKAGSQAGKVETLASGNLRGLAHSASGTASLLELEDGSTYLRLENLDVENGPDLRVYLSRASSSSNPEAFDDDFLDLGDLKGNVGNQNYRIPNDADLSPIKSAVIWCRRFSVGFAVAPLE